MKPILFNSEMVCAILDGEKTTTRRIIKPQPELSYGRLTWVSGPVSFNTENASEFVQCAPYRPGDVLYVRETYAENLNSECIAGKTGKCPYSGCENPEGQCFQTHYVYFTDKQIVASNTKWHPSIHMPKEAARIFLKVTDVKAERLQEIDVDGAISEGAWGDGVPNLPFSLLYAEHPNASCNAVASFAHIWDGTVKKSDLDRYGWAANPWTWVISFERCEKP